MKNRTHGKLFRPGQDQLFNGGKGLIPQAKHLAYFTSDAQNVKRCPHFANQFVPVLDDTWAHETH